MLANHFGHRVPVQLVVEGGSGPAPGASASPAGSGPAPGEPPPDDHDDAPHPAEIAALPDADVTVGGVDLLLREFGGEIVQEERPET